MRILKIGRHRIEIHIRIRHHKLPNLKGIWDGNELISKRAWKKYNKSGCSIVGAHHPSKLKARVRFSPPAFELYKKYNEYELRFLQVLMSKKKHDTITHLQEVQGMKKKKVFLDHSGLIYEHIDM